MLYSHLSTQIKTLGGQQWSLVSPMPQSCIEKQRAHKRFTTPEQRAQKRIMRFAVELAHFVMAFLLSFVHIDDQQLAVC